MEVVGEFLGMDSDKAVWGHFRRHWQCLFPGLGSRSVFVRQAANLWFVRQRLQAMLSRRLEGWGDTVHLAEGFPLPVCHFARAARCRLFRGEAACGHCASKVVIGGLGPGLAADESQTLRLLGTVAAKTVVAPDLVADRGLVTLQHDGNLALVVPHFQK